VATKLFLRARRHGPWRISSNIPKRTRAFTSVVLEDSAACSALIFAFLGIFLGRLTRCTNPLPSTVIAYRHRPSSLMKTWPGFSHRGARGSSLGERCEPRPSWRHRGGGWSRIRRLSGPVTCLTMFYMGPQRTAREQWGCGFTPGTCSRRRMHTRRSARIEADLRSAYPETNRVLHRGESLPREAAAMRAAAEVRNGAQFFPGTMRRSGLLAPSGPSATVRG